MEGLLFASTRVFHHNIRSHCVPNYLVSRFGAFIINAYNGNSKSQCTVNDISEKLLITLTESTLNRQTYMK